MKYYFFIFSFFYASILFAQSKDSYFPIIPGKKVDYKMRGVKFTHSFTDSIFLEGRMYYFYSKEGPSGYDNIVELIHISNDTVYSFKESSPKKHVPKYVLIPKVGSKVGMATVVKTNHKLKLKNGRIYSDLLVIKFNHYEMYYYFKKGVGLIAKKMDGKLFLVIDE
jgi:hypothetical protein